MPSVPTDLPLLHNQTMASVSVDLRRVLDNNCPIIAYTLVARAIDQQPASSPKLTVAPYELNHVSAADLVCIQYTVLV